MTQKIVFLDRASVPAHVDIRPPSFEHDWQNYDNCKEDEIVGRAKNADIIVTNKVPLSADTIAQLPNLKHVAVYATGFNIIDIDACRKRNILVTNTPDYAATAVSEHAMALVFSLRRHLFAYRQSVADGVWNQSPFFHGYIAKTFDLKGARLGVIGGGCLGQGIAALGKGIGMDAYFSDRKGSVHSNRAGYLPFDEIIETCDVISIHCPLNDETRNLIDLDELSRMKKEALLINTSRGGIVNESDLVTALQRGLIAGAGFDVASIEPLKDDNPLCQLQRSPNFILTPHVAWTSESSLNDQADILTNNIEKYYEGTPVNSVL